MSGTFHRQGAALILVLWAIAVLSLLAGGLSFVIRQDLAIANIERDRLTAHWLARAGVERAIAEIMDDASSTLAIDTLDDSWGDNELAFGDVELVGGTFSVIRDGYEPVPNVWYGVDDESAKLNVNVATHDQLMTLRDMTSPIASAIIDWRDRDFESRPDGVEHGHYAGLSHPYTIRNGPLRTLRELLLVRSVTPELFYGEDLNVNGLLDANEDDGNANNPGDNQDSRLDRGWFSYLTVFSYQKNVNRYRRNRIKLNSADAGTLSQRLSLEMWAAESIVKARQEKEFKHLVDLLDVKRDPNTATDDSAEEDINPRSDSEQNQPVTTAIFQRIVDDLTLTDDEWLPGLVNINTAPREVLLALPDVDEDQADAIIRNRQVLSGYTSIGELIDITGITKEKFAKLENSVTVRSNVFRIGSHGRAASGMAKATIECVVDRNEEVPRILYWLESSP